MVEKKNLNHNKAKTDIQSHVATFRVLQEIGGARCSRGLLLLPELMANTLAASAKSQQLSFLCAGLLPPDISVPRIV